MLTLGGIVIRLRPVTIEGNTDDTTLFRFIVSTVDLDSLCMGQKDVVCDAKPEKSSAYTQST